MLLVLRLIGRPLFMWDFELLTFHISTIVSFVLLMIEITRKRM